MGWRIGGAVLAAALLLAACGGRASDADADGSPAAGSPTTGTATDDGKGGYDDDGGQGGGGGATEGTLGQADFSFSPAKITVASGDTITVQNVGAAPHTFTVSGEDVDVTNQPGDTTEVTIDLPPGTYPFICRFHERSGMTGTLTVT